MGCDTHCIDMSHTSMQLHANTLVGICGQLQTFFQGPCERSPALAVCSEGLRDGALPSASPLFFFESCGCLRWTREVLAAAGAMAVEVFRGFQPIKNTEQSFFWCRLAENCEAVSHDKEEPWVCTVPCAHVLESPQLINSNYF